LDFADQDRNREDLAMPKCRNCGMDMGPEQTCVFATFKVEKDGQELLVCCERCAGLVEEAPPVEAAPVHEIAKMMPPAAPRPALKVPRKQAPKKAPKKAKKAPKKAKKAPKKAKKAPKKAKKAPKKAKKAPKKARKTAKKAKRPGRKAARKGAARKR